MAYDNSSFTGKASEWYIDTSLETLQMGDNEIREQNDFQNGLPLNELFGDSPSNQFPSHQADQNRFDTLVEQIRIMGESDAIGLKDDPAFTFNTLFLNTEKEMVQKASYFIERIETLCSDELILPETTPKLQTLLKQVTDIFPEIEILSEKTHQTGDSFIHELIERDH